MSNYRDRSSDNFSPRGNRGRASYNPNFDGDNRLKGRPRFNKSDDRPSTGTPIAKVAMTATLAVQDSISAMVMRAATASTVSVVKEAAVVAISSHAMAAMYSARDVMAAHAVASVAVTRPTMPAVRDPSQTNIPPTAVQSMATRETAREHTTPMQSTAARNARHSAMRHLTPMLRCA